MKFDGKVGGFDEMHKLLKELPVTVEKKVLQRATVGALRDVRKTIAAAAPVHDGPQSEASKKYGTGKKNIRVGRLRRVQKGQKGARIHTGDAFWLLIYELGNYIQQELGTRYQPARPWFAPAFREAHPKIIQFLADRLRLDISKELEKYRNGKR